MASARTTASLFALILAAAACGSGGSTPASGASPAPDGSTGGPVDPGPDDPAPPGRDAGADDASGDASALPKCPAPAGLGRGLTWVRANPMMISGLSVAMGSAPKAAVDEYFDAFHANAVHLWQTGLPTEITSWSAAGHAGFRFVSWVDKDGKSTANGEVLGGAPSLPGRIGYQIGDEPQSQSDLDQMKAGAAAVKAADPVGLRIVNLNDSDEANDLRTKAANLPDFDVLSYDHYTMGHNAYGGMMSTRAAALGAGKPYWRYMKSFYYKDDSPEGDPSDFRWDAFVGAVFGFTGYTWFVYTIPADNADVAPLLFSAGGDYAAAKTARYAQVAEVNEQLARLGRALVMLHSTDVRYVKSLLNLTGLPDWSPGAGGDPYLTSVARANDAPALLVGLFRDDCDEPYVMIQNQAHEQADFPNDNDHDATFTLGFDFSKSTDASLDETKVSALDLTTGAPVAHALTSTGAHTAELEVTLPAGGVLLFKYADARPFALQ